MTLRNLRLSERTSNGVKATWFDSPAEAAECVRSQFLMPNAPYLKAAAILKEKCGIDPFTDVD
jgi:hypothetical protein